MGKLASAIYGVNWMAKNSKVRLLNPIFVILPLFLFGCTSTPIFNNPNKCIGKIGTSRTINLAQFKGQNFGSIGFQKLDLKPYEVVLTFDDGPTEDVTPSVISTLKNDCTNATFFMIGNNIEKNAAIGLKVLKSGNSIGLHSYSHLSMQSLDDKAQIEDFEQVRQIAKETFGNKSAPFYRFPFLKNTDNLIKHANKNGYNIMSVDVIAYDWEENATSETIINNVLNGLEKNNNSGIVLMHDNRKINIEALPKLLDALKANNYKIVKLDYRD